MEIYDIHDYIKKISGAIRAIIKIAIFKGIFKYETHIQTKFPVFCQ